MYAALLSLALIAPGSAQDAPFVVPAPSAFTLPPVPAVDGPGMHFETVRQPARGARGLRDGGIVLAAIGGTGLVASTVLGVAAGLSSSNCEFECMGPALFGSSALVAAAFSAPFAIAGGSMWGVGQRRMDRPPIGLSLRGRVSPEGGGVGVDLVF
jgi:hypothetical protein